MSEKRSFRRDALPICASLRDQMSRHSEAAYPDEACGALFGVAVEGGGPLVTRAVPMPNSARLPGEGYCIEPAALERACISAAGREESLIGFYHSHPDRVASPSERDRETAMPGMWYVTIPVRGGRAGARKVWFSAAPAGPGVRCPS